MKAIAMERSGEAGVLIYKEGLPKPIPSPGQALVKIHAAGINFVDIYQRKGLYPVTLPYVPGLEASGTIETVEGNSEFKPGDRVAYTGHPGSYSEYTAIKMDRLIKLPDELTFEQGAAFPLQGMTAHYLLHAYRKPGPGDTVLVHAAAGGVGGLLVQWAKHLGATVIGTVSTDEKARIAKGIGADHVILYSRDDFVNEVNRITNGHGVDIVLDGVGKSTFAGSLEVVKVRGQVVIFGSASGPADPIVPNALMPKSFTLSGGSLGNFVAARKELLERSGAVLDGIKKGWLKLRIDRVLPLAEAAEAHRLLEGRKTMGKLVLKVRD